MFFDENKHDALIQDLGEENWYMAVTFIILFFISLFYGTSVMLIKVRKTEVLNNESA